MSSIETTRQHIAESVRVKSALLDNPAAMEAIARIADICTEAYRRGNKVIWAGNGGSAADAQHMAGEMVSKFYFDRPAIPSIALTGISTSGNSHNLLESLPMCRQVGVTAVALVGANPSLMDDWDIVVKIPSSSTPRIQECQTLIGHIICCIVEENLFASKYKNKKP